MTVCLHFCQIEVDMNASLAGALTGLLVAAGPAGAGVIDFETLPGGVQPTDGQTIADTYRSTFGVSFSLEGGGSPVIAEVGAPRTAFAGPPNDSSADVPAADQGVGRYFLTDDGALSGLSAEPLIIDYLTPTQAAGGDILDIDFDERWTIEARDDLGNILDTVVLAAGDAGTGDGLATRWTFSFADAEFTSIRIAGDRDAAGAFGLAFDNFTPTTVPLPGAAWMLGAGLAALALQRRARAAPSRK
jgi:hypothetical protein